MSGKRIGFIDYNLDNFHARVYLEALRGPLSYLGFTVAGATAMLSAPSEAWATERELRFFANVEELANEVDHFAILAPSNPETHLELCRQALPYGKPTFVDKTFAPDLKTAADIFRIADEFRVAVQSTSALRYTNVQSTVARLASPLQSMFITAGGSSFAEYGIHPVELAISCFGPEVQGLMRLGSGQRFQLVLSFANDRTAILDFNETADIPFSSVLVTAEGSEHVTVDSSKLFVDAAKAILDFFTAGIPQFDREETLVIRRILDVATTAEVENKFASINDLQSVKKSPRAPHWKQSELEEVLER